MDTKEDSLEVLKTLIHDALEESSLPAPLALFLKERLFDFYCNHGIPEKNLGDAVAYIYANQLADHHHIYMFSIDNCLILPAKMAFPRDVLLETLKAYKQEGNDVGSPIGQQFLQDVTLGLKVMHEHLMSYKKSTRKFVDMKPVPEFPGYDVLKRFHECERKTPYETRLHAEHKIEPEQTSYQCSHCSNWHNGHPPRLQNLDRETLERRYQRTWRRYKKV